MSTYIIGDVQGCYDPLLRLLEKIRFDQTTDQLWFAGDLVNRGGRSLESLRLVHSIRNNVISVMGNHDLHLLSIALRTTKTRKIRNPEFRAIVEADDGSELLDWLLHRPFLHRDKERGIILVHAGLLPGWSIPQARVYAKEAEAALRGKKQQKFLRVMYGNDPDTWHEELGYWQRVKLATNIFTRMRLCIDPNRMDFEFKGAIKDAPAGYLPWFDIHTMRKKKWTVVFGHWAALGLMVRKNLICLDSGCVWGGKLTAMRIEDREIFQVDGSV